MFLSQLTIGRSDAARRKLRDTYAWHQKLWELFPGRDGAPREFLFRVDDIRTGFRALILSAAEPRVPEWAVVQTKAVAPSFLNHARYRFQLRANPTMRRSSDGRRLGIYAEDRLRDWILRKADHGGFEVEAENLVIGGPQDVIFLRNGKRGKHVGVDFRGMLSVKERDLFKEAFEKGIGSAKSFGFGLLMLQPVD